MVVPKKRFGQHFLKSKGVVEKIADALEITPEDTVVEIGPGTGVLTEELLKREPKKLITLELDRELIPFLEEKFKGYPQFEVINADASKVDFCKFGKNLKLVGNLPYNVGSLIVLNTVLSKDCVDRAVYMLQKEVAERLTLRHRKPSWLGIFLNTFFDTEYLMSVPPRFFDPPPKVVSAVIRMTPKGDAPDYDLSDYKRFLEKLFSDRRKMLRKKLPQEVLEKANVDSTKRVEELNLEDFKRLYEAWKSLI
ncbi:MAG TPA: 16S rRNA (adenine(1518)-N(6)/adenine(1519)-N(6))-dimethyltransferase RsmA [Aquificales bacterium]|nr:16S rRNA (adenine(1518)-N(6)/adenine(1519)-N(6))-dimethyltransferase RsmA [Aquificales bacterium]